MLYFASLMIDAGECFGPVKLCQYLFYAGDIWLFFCAVYGAFTSGFYRYIIV